MMSSGNEILARFEYRNHGEIASRGIVAATDRGLPRFSTDIAEVEEQGA